MQKWIGTGNLTRDVEKVSENLVKFTIAIPEDYVKEDGERPVQFFTIICWNKLAENCARYLKKGSKVLVEGKLQNRTYEQNGTKKYITEILARAVEFLSVKKDEPKLTPIEDNGTMPF